MDWRDVLDVGLVVIGSLGGGGMIVFGLSGFLAKVWVDRMKGDIDAQLRRLDSALSHEGFLLKRFAELELDAIAACWGAARACLPRLNAVRPNDSGTDEATLIANAKVLGDAHNELLAALGKHEPFLTRSIAERLEAIRRVVALEISHVRHHEHFKRDWWEAGEKNQRELETLTDSLRDEVKNRIRVLRAEAAAAQSKAYS